MRQAVHLLDHAVRAGMPTLGHAFQPLLAPLDEFSLKIIEKALGPKIPMVAGKREVYFTPYLGNLRSKEQHLLEKNGRFLKDNLVFGRSIQKLGTFLFCLDYAQSGPHDIPGIWKDVEQLYSGPKMKALLTLLTQVNTFRNTHIAHVETPLKDPDLAWQALEQWLKCLSIMASMAL